MNDNTFVPRNAPLPDEQHYVKLAGPYHRYELHLLANAQRQLGRIPFAVSRDKYGVWLWRSRDGYIESIQ